MNKRTLIAMLLLSSTSCVKQATARFEVEAQSFAVDEEIFFSNRSIGAKSQHWNFGDGGSSDEYAPVHRYQHEGTYRVRLTVNGGSAEMEMDIRIDHELRL